METSISSSAGEMSICHGRLRESTPALQLLTRKQLHDSPCAIQHTSGNEGVFKGEYEYPWQTTNVPTIYREVVFVDQYAVQYLWNNP